MSAQNCIIEAPIESRGEYAIFAVSRDRGATFAEIAELMEESWKADYADETRMVYNRDFLEWLLGAEHWSGLVVRHSQSGALAAFVYSLWRRVSVTGSSHPAVFSSGLSVAPRFRGRGLARWTHEIGSRLMFDDPDSRIIEVAAFQLGHSGLPTDQSSAAKNQKERTVYLEPREIWRKRLELSQKQVGPSIRNASLQLLRSDMLAARHSALFENTLRHASVAFLPEANYLHLYANERQQRSGMLVVDFRDGTCGGFLFSFIPTAINEHLIGNLGQIQGVLGSEDEANITAGLAAAINHLQEAGCIAVSIVDQGGFSVQILEKLGFGRSGEKLIYKLRGSRSLLETSRDLVAPFALDFY